MTTTQNIDPKILSKIQKCLALASSDNPNEAATALRQAHALMAKYGVTSEAITMADIGESKISSRTMARNKPSAWETHLAATVGKAFGCKLMVSRFVPKEGVKLPKGSRGVFNEGGFIFVGLKSQVEIAAYTAQVLVRKCQRARSQWIHDKLSGISSRPGGKKLVTAMGDEFALGWVAQIQRLVHDFAHPPEIDSAIDQYIESAATTGAPDAQTRHTRTENERAIALARLAGMAAAKGESLHRPVNGAHAAPLLER
jgi:hypothetical protein